MKFSVNWLREFVELPNDLAQLAELLTLAGVEIEGIEKRGADFENVVVARITESKPHPNADRLSVCMVEDGSGKPRQIVCGAKNYKVGDKVPLALPGAVLPNDLKIRASKLRGVESEGMLCSAKELGLSEERAGLLILSPEAKIGAPIGTLFPADNILDVEITPNRSDLLSHFGLAREIGALLEKPLRLPDFLTSKKNSPASEGGVRIAAQRECPFYSARRIEHVAVGPAPDWIRARIEACGIRSINNIVDITNFVMLEIGQPLHAFDADKLQGEINVRLARPEEKFLALDGKTYSLGEHDLVVADGARAVAIAGVMGGEDTGVTADTRNLLLESAWFLPASVRHTARELNLPSDASYRFERGVDPEMILRASARATDLIAEFAGGKSSAKIATAGALPSAPAPVTLRYDRCDRLLGATIATKTADHILQSFGLQKTDGGKEKAVWQIPSYRRDLLREVDLIEEIVRVHGIDKIPATDRSRFTPISTADRAYDFEMKLRLQLSALGLNEVRTSKLIPRDASVFGEGAIQLRNPLNEDHVALRQNLLGGMIDVVARNIRAGAERVALFEIGRVFAQPNGEQEHRVAIVMWGRKTGEAHWRANQGRLDFFDLKGAVESIVPETSKFERSSRPFLALAAEIKNGGEFIGIAGQLSATLAASIDAPGGVFVAEIFLDSPSEIAGPNVAFREVGKFPAITRDIAMIAKEELTHEEILRAILGEPLLERARIFDQLIGEEAAQRFGPGRKSLAYTLTYRDKNRTLTNDEVAVVHTRIRERLQRELGVELRE